MREILSLCASFTAIIYKEVNGPCPTETQPLAGFFILQVYGLRYFFFERELRIAFYCQALLVLLDYQRRLENISGIRYIKGSERKTSSHAK
jgi:hypothetical protein